MQMRSSDENSSVCLSDAYEIGCQLLLITNRRSHTGFRLISISVTLNGITSIILRFSPNLIALLACYVTAVEARPIMAINIVSQFQIFTFDRVYTDPGKSWNFIVQNSRPWKVLEKGIGPGKPWKVLEF